MEILVMNDCSEDSTEDVVSNIGDCRIRHVRNHTNLGVPGNVNRGICESRGQFVFVMHDTDLAEPSMIRRMHDLLEANPGVSYAHTGLVMKDSAGRTIRQYVGDFPEVTPGQAWLPRMIGKLDSDVSAMTMAPRAIYEQWGMFDSEYGFLADVEWALRMCLHGDVGYIAKPILTMREREANHPFKRIRWETFDWSIQMRRKYLPSIHDPKMREEVAGLLARNIEKSLVLAILSCIKHGDIKRLRQGKDTLQQYGTALPKLMARLL